MPLNHKDGEEIGTLGRGNPVPLTKWADSRFFNMAAGMAAKAFVAKGALLPIQFDQLEVLVQEYPQKDRLAFIFLRVIAGKEHFFPWVFTLEPDVISELVNTGKWSRVN